VAVTSKELDVWLDRVAAELGTTDLDFSNDTIHTLLDLARDSAHEVERIAAPLTTFLVGVAVGRGASVGEAAARVTELALQDPPSPGDGGTAGSGAD
jgi:uncharacterized protein DUF6457